MDVYRATVLAKILYCSSAWSGLTSASDRNRIDAFPRKSKRLGYRNVDTPSVADLFATADDALFSQVLSNSDHVLQRLLPDQSSHHYNLRNRRHQLQLTNKTTHINNKLSIIRALFKDSYQLTLGLTAIFVCVSLISLHFLSFILRQIVISCFYCNCAFVTIH